MTNVYRESDATLETLAGRTIAVLGYGNQGRSQARNLRDSGQQVVIGNIADAYAERARQEGFQVQSLSEAISCADIVLALLPDEVLAERFDRELKSSFRPGQTLVFASGYSVAFGHIGLPDEIDVVLLAPRTIGAAVRERYLSGEGFFSFVAVERDVSGRARATVLALALAIGSLKKGAVEVSFRVEAELDLFNEQGFGPAFGRVLLTAMQTLLDAGYPKEAVLLEIYLSGELGDVCRDMARTGLIGQLEHHSPTSQYGAITRGIRFLGMNLRRPMRRVLEDIQSGRFSREWSFEQRLGRVRFRLLRAIAVRQPIARLERAVRRRLSIFPDRESSRPVDSH